MANEVVPLWRLREAPHHEAKGDRDEPNRPPKHCLAYVIFKNTPIATAIRAAPSTHRGVMGLRPSIAIITSIRTNATGGMTIQARAPSATVIIPVMALTIMMLTS
jgi:hypothetical protein